MIPPALLRRLAELAPVHGIRLALVFGSVVTGKVHQRSDFDLALAFERAPNDTRTLAELHHELQVCVPGRELDLAIINHADPLFLYRILTTCDLAYGRPEDLQKLKLYAFRRYQDHRRFFEMEREYVRRFLDRLPRAS